MSSPGWRFRSAPPLLPPDGRRQQPSAWGGVGWAAAADTPGARPGAWRPVPRQNDLVGNLPDRVPRGRSESAGAPRAPDDTGRVVRTVAIDVGGDHWERLMIRTHVIQPGEDIVAVMERYARPYLRPGDWVFVGQKAVSIAQGRLVQERSVRPRPLAVFLSRHVKRTPFGRGLGRPTTMEIALREAGVARILLACAVHLAGRPLGRSGDFYRIAGRKVASIDGVTDWALPPFNRYIVLHPDDADGLCARITSRLQVPAAIVDLNDLGGEVLGASPDLDRRLVVKVLADNPLGQGPFRTPLGIARRGASSEPATPR